VDDPWPGVGPRLPLRPARGTRADVGHGDRDGAASGPGTAACPRYSHSRPHKEKGLSNLGSLEKLGHVYDGLNYASDFPGGEWRRMPKPTGMRYSLVNDAVTFENNACTGGLPASCSEATT
jgi:hypothetical protein